jgi:hypothetical protein
MRTSKLAVALFTAAILSGCAHTSWQEYADTNNCQPTGNSDLKKEVNSVGIQSGNGMGLGVPATIAIPTVSVRRVYQFQCDNGVIWAYQTKGKQKE